MKKILIYTFLFLFYATLLNAQHENKNWYFGNGTDGLIFTNNIPVKNNNKYNSVGFEGMVVVSDPFSGELLFYSDGATVINKNHQLMNNGTGLNGHYSCAQGVLSIAVPGSCMKQFYLFTNSAYDGNPGYIDVSLIDFTNNPLGDVVIKNTSFWTGPNPVSDQGMCMIKKPNSNDFWFIVSRYNLAEYWVWPITTAGFGSPAIYTFANTGSCYQLNFNSAAQKLVVTGWGNKHVTTIDFNDVTGVMSNEVQLAQPGFGDCYGARFSPDGSKLYVGVDPPSSGLWQYDFNNTTWTDMNTCCFAHDVKMGPDGKMYHIRTYNSTQPIAVIDYPDSSAVSNACNYHTINFPPAFNGLVRRFPEFLTSPDPPLAIADTFSVLPLTNTVLNVLVNDTDIQGDSIFIDSLFSTPLYGTALLNNGTLTYTADSFSCGNTDTLIYRIKDINCSYDTALILIYINCNNLPVAIFQASDSSFCEKKCLDFYDFSTNNPTSWQWFFPGADSASSNEQNPLSICYNSYGSFDVTLIACNAFGCDTLMFTDFIHVNQSPNAPVITANFDTLFSTWAHSYQWYYNNLLIPGANNQYYIYNQQGAYAVIVSDSNGCQSSSIVVYTDLAEYENELFNPEIFPNPNDGHFTIHGSDRMQPHLKIKIFDALGSVVFDKDFLNCRLSFYLNAGPGMYMLQVDDGIHLTKRKILIFK